MKFKLLFMAVAAGVVSVTGCSGKLPPSIGMKNGMLAPCPDKPNCVSSQAEDPEHKIDPILYKSSREVAYSILIDILQNEKRTKIVTSRDNYIHAECTSAIFRFIDDMELYFNDTGKIIHVRSASRIGYSDMGVNRKRIEELRGQFEKRDGNQRE